MSGGQILTLLCVMAALTYGAISIRWILAQSSGNDRMCEIAAAIQEGASAYLNRQYSTIGVVGATLFLVTWLILELGWKTAIGFALGAILSGLTGYIGMHVWCAPMCAPHMLHMPASTQL